MLKQHAEIKEIEQVHYSRIVVKILFVIILLVALSISLDFGIFAASSVEIKQSIGNDNFKFGALQTFVFIGILAGRYEFW